MKKDFQRAAFATTLGLSALMLAGPAQAALIVDITGVAGSGQSTWTFSGSSTAVGTGFFDDDNGLAGNDAWQNIGDYTNIDDDEHTTITGSATLTIAGTTRNIDLVYIDDDSTGTPSDDFGVGVDGTTDFTFSDGDLISWTGSLLTQIDLNDLNLSGIPVTFNVSNYGDTGAMLPLTINIGTGTAAVPVAPTLALLGLGLVGLGRRRG